jgi:hypothetical protein
VPTSGGRHLGESWAEVGFERVCDRLEVRFFDKSMMIRPSIFLEVSAARGSVACPGHPDSVGARRE